MSDNENDNINHNKENKIDESLIQNLNPKIKQSLHPNILLTPTKRNRISSRISILYENHTKLVTSNLAGEDELDLEVENTNTQTSPFKENSLTYSNNSYNKLNLKGELGFWATLFTYIKVNTVAGFLFLPLGFMNGGWLFSIVAIILIASFAIYCSIALSDCTDIAKTFSFSKIGEKAAGRFGFYLVEIGIGLCQICFTCSYANLITQTLNNMMNLWFNNQTNYHIYIGLVLGIIVIPLCLIRNVSKLSPLLILGDLAILTIVGSLIYESVYEISEDPNFNLDNFKRFNTKWYNLLAMAVSSLEGVGVVLPLKENMKDKKHFKWVIIIGTYVITLIYIIFPLSMYLCYQNDVKEIILNNLPLEKIYIQVVLGFFIFSVLIVYPFTLYPAFRIFENLFFKKEDPDKDHFYSISWKNFVRILILVFTIIVGILSIGKFETLVAVVGASFCTPIALIIPSIFHFILHRKTQSKFRSSIDLLFFLIGISISVIVLLYTAVL